jgi:hypothetical protein
MLKPIRCLQLRSLGSFGKRESGSGAGFGEVGCDTGDAGAGDRAGAEGEGGALGGEGRAEEEDWVSAGVIREGWLLMGRVCL